jgi:hypothetical protein
MTNPIRDAITGFPATIERHNQWVLVGHNGRDEIWLTPTAARELAAQVLDAARQLEAEGNYIKQTCTCAMTQTVGDCPRHDGPEAPQ